MDVEFSVLQERPPRGARHQRNRRKLFWKPALTNTLATKDLLIFQERSKLNIITLLVEKSRWNTTLREPTQTVKHVNFTFIQEPLATTKILWDIITGIVAKWKTLGPQRAEPSIRANLMGRQRENSRLMLATMLPRMMVMPSLSTTRLLELVMDAVS